MDVQKGLVPCRYIHLGVFFFLIMAGREKNCKWYFADQPNGQEVGPNNAMEQSFKNHPYASLVRESIQNSLDAVLDKSQPVQVKFSIMEMQGADYPEFFELQHHIKGCLEYFPNNHNAKVTYEPMCKLFDGNRYHELHVLGKKFREVFSEVSGLCKDMDDKERKALAEYTHTFRQLETSAFFQKVGEFEGFRQESAILQQRSGYSQIYKAWLMLKNSLDLVDGKTDIGMKKIWELYEIWCFLVMKRLIAKVLDLDLNDMEHVREDKSQMLNTMARSEMTHVVEFDNRANGDVVRLEYQHTYNRSTKEFKTTTTEQRPDIVVTIRKPDGFVLTYLYDAKYRVQDDKNDCELDEGTDIDIADYPLPDAINQMHRYRDAIYYAMKEDERPRGKEIIGGYILFPGRTEGDAIENRYFYKSIKKVNIGAFPLLPADKEHQDEVVLCNLLEKHLQEILLYNSVYEQIKDSIPQKGLQYSLRPKQGDSMVLVGYAKQKSKDLFLHHKIYYTRAELEVGSLRLRPGFEWARYLLLHDARNAERKLYLLN